MSVADTPAGPHVVPFVAAAPAPHPMPAPLPAVEEPTAPPVAPWNQPSERPEHDLPAGHPLAGLPRSARQLLALGFVAAYVGCVLVEPEPDGPHPHYDLWLLPIDLGSLAALVVGAVLLWRGSRGAQLWGVLAGVGMAVETVLCPASGHHVIGGFTWVQTGLSMFVLLTSVALPGLARRARERAGSVPA